MAAGVGSFPSRLPQHLSLRELTKQLGKGRVILSTAHCGQKGSGGDRRQPVSHTGLTLGNREMNADAQLLFILIRTQALEMVPPTFGVGLLSSAKPF